MDKNLGETLAFTNKEEEIDLRILLNIFKINKKLISIITVLSFLIGYCFSLTRPKIWEGEFQIVLDSASSNTILSLENLPFTQSKSADPLKTEIGILESPLVLSDVFQFVKEFKNNSTNEKLNLSFKKWKKSNLSIELLKGSSILNIVYKDSNKDIILPVLKKISSKYQSYSKRDRQKEISRILEYLNIQRDLINKQYQKSSENFNKFSIENSLGNNYSLSNLKSYESLGNYNSIDAALNKIDIDSGQRFQKQFALLEQLESEYIDLSSRFKPNSRTLKELKNKIDNLRLALRRPNEIIIKYKELGQTAMRDELTLIEINNKYQKTKLEQLQSPEPWELISTPNLNPNHISPNKSTISLIFLIIGFLSSYVYVYFKDIERGVIYNKEIINSIPNIPILNELNFKGKKLISSTIEYILNTENIAKKEKIAFLVIGGIEINNLVPLKEVLDEDFSDYEINLIGIDSDINLYSKILIISCSGYSKINDLKIINQKLLVQNKPILGLISLSL